MKTPQLGKRQPLILLQNVGFVLVIQTQSQPWKMRMISMALTDLMDLMDPMAPMAQILKKSLLMKRLR